MIGLEALQLYRVGHDEEVIAVIVPTEIAGPCGEGEASVPLQQVDKAEFRHARQLQGADGLAGIEHTGAYLAEDDAAHHVVPVVEALV